VGVTLGPERLFNGFGGGLSDSWSEVNAGWWRTWALKIIGTVKVIVIIWVIHGYVSFVGGITTGL
jgi:hypothetical protein